MFVSLRSIGKRVLSSEVEQVIPILIFHCTALPDDVGGIVFVSDIKELYNIFPKNFNVHGIWLYYILRKL